MLRRAGRKSGRGLVSLRVATGISRIDLMILGFLLERPMHGYEINQILSSDEMQNWVNLGRTTTYYSLSKLKKEGLVEEIVERQEDKPEKSVFHVTDKGREEFFNSLHQMLASSERLYFDYNIGLFFINKLVRDKATEALKVRRDFLRKWLAELSESVKTETDKESLPLTWQAVTEHTRILVEREIEWLGQFIQEVERKAKAPAKSKKLAALVGEEEHTVMTLRGTLKEYVLSDIIHLIEVGSYTGTLFIKRGSLLRTVSFVEGTAIYVTSSSHAPKGDGELSPKEASLVLKDLYDAFGWLDGSYVLQPDNLVEEGGVAIEISNHSIILEGCRRVEEWDRIGKIVTSNEMVFQASDSVEETGDLDLTPKEKVVLAAINGLRDVGDLADYCNQSIFETSKILYCFTLAGLLSIVSPEKARTMKLLKHFSKLKWDAVDAIAGKKTIVSIEKEINEKARQSMLPFVLNKGVFEETISAPIELDRLVEMEKLYLSIQIEVIVKNLGKDFGRQLFKSAVEKLTPEMTERFLRYGFDKILVLK